MFGFVSLFWIIPSLLHKWRIDRLFSLHKGSFLFRTEVISFCTVETEMSRDFF